MIEADPDYFQRLKRQQNPRFLWIGCSDSRVPANQIIDVQPGEVFVHRNVANLVVNSDINCLSVVHYAVEVLKVEHIIVCGHYGCGGVAAALSRSEFGLIDNWLRHVKDVYADHAAELDTLPETARSDRLCELNVLTQAAHMCRTTIVQGAWRRGQPLTVHAWIYRLADGRIRELGRGTSDPNGLGHVYQTTEAP